MDRSGPIGCFISYCHEDIDRASLDYLVNLLEETSSQRYSISYDQKLKVGEDIKKFMSILDEVDAVIIILSPAYKRRVMDRQGGVYEEYVRVIQRFETLEREKRAGKKVGEIEGYFDLIPLLFTGSNEESVPEEIDHLKYLNFVGFRATKNDKGEFIVTDTTRRKFVPQVKQIADRLLTSATLKDKSFDQLYGQYFSRLFRETRADWRNPRHGPHNYIDSLFVKTYAYNLVKTQASYFIIGRKGSGKSTVSDVLPVEQGRRYKDVIRINADDFNLEQLYAFLSEEQIGSDMKNVFRRLKCFEFAWEAFVYVCCAEVLLKMSKLGELVEDHDGSLISPLASVVEEIKRKQFREGESTEDKGPYFTFTFNEVKRFMEQCIKNARSDKRFFFSDIEFSFSRSAFLTQVLTEQGLKNFDEIIRTCRRGFLVTLDGFDTAFDMFRRDTIINYREDDLRKRTSFEIDWLRSLLELVLLIKQTARDGNPLYDLLEFCITVPKDRFLELLRTDRDAYRYRNRYCSLNWSGIELAILLRKRLEELSQYSTDKKRTAEDRLVDVLRSKFAHIPLEITFDFNDRQVTMPLFMYVLRHTFWRPRDVLLYYAKIISTAEAMRKRGYKISTEVIRRTIKDTTCEVIKDEFINEFSSTVINISEIVESFKGRHQLMPYAEITGILTNLDFRYASSGAGTVEVAGKIELLYQIGFLGVFADEPLRQRFNLKSRHAFYFNEGIMPLRSVGKDRYEGLVFIIHPIFCEYLGLITKDQDITLNFTWDELHEMEDVLFASGTNFLVF